MYFFIKTTISAFVIAGVSELGKRSSVAAALLASLPLTSILAMIWLYRDTGDVQRVVELSHGILWAVIPSLLFFMIFPMLVKLGLRFTPAMLASSAMMGIGYFAYLMIVRKLGTH